MRFAAQLIWFSEGLCLKEKISSTDLREHPVLEVGDGETGPFRQGLDSGSPASSCDPGAVGSSWAAGAL